MSEAIISLEKVEKSYGKFKVLKNVNLEINRGEIYGLVGKNGAGKTTIFKIILGLSDFQDGRVTICGESENLREGRKKIGFFVGSNFFPYMTARQNLEYYRMLKGIKDKKEIDRVLKIVGLDQAKGRYKNFSLGMKQRLGIANAIMGTPEILILDEPTNGLDPQGIADVRKLARQLHEEYGMTVIISSHILSELQNTAHTFGIVNNGTVPRTVTQEDLINADKAVRVTVDDLERAKEVLEAAGIQILDEVLESKSLEDFYFDTIGGEN